MTDLAGATAVPGLWAAGEVAGTGVHGANRLASNSLLEGMVFGPRVIEAIGRGVDGPSPTGAMRAVLEGGRVGDTIPGRRLRRPGFADGAARAMTGATDEHRALLQRAMTRCAGVLRSASSLAEARRVIDDIHAAVAPTAAHTREYELVNLLTVADAMLAGAAAREESRGCHTREDFPAASDAFRVRLVQ